MRTRCAARPQPHGPRPPRRPRRPQHAVRPRSGKCAVRVPRRADTMVKCRRRVGRERCRRHELRQALVLVQARSHFLPAPTCTYFARMPASKTLRRLQIVTCTVCADRRQRGQPTALLMPSVGRVGDCCCRGLLPRAQMTHVHTSSKQHSLGRVIVPMSTAPILCRWAVQPRGALAIALSSAQRSMRRSPQSDATKPARA